MTVRELRELAAKKAQEARDIKDKASAENRTMTKQEADEYDNFCQQARTTIKEAERQEELESIEAKLNQPQERQSTPEIATGERIETVGGPKLYRAGQLRAFKGPQADVEAYRSGQFLRAIMGNARARQWCDDANIQVRAQTEGVNAAGGFVVPQEMERAVIDLRETYGMFRANARRVAMSTDNVIIPRRASGVTAYFVGETTEITASDMAWNQVELTAKKLAALTRMSTDLSDDAIINVADTLADEMAWAFAKKEDECGLDGDGTATYGGMVGIRTKFVDGSHTAGYDAGTSPCTAWSHITLADEIVTLMSKLPTYALPRAKWYIHPAGKAACFDALALAAGGNTTREIASGAQPMFAGYPVVVSSAMPSAPTNGTVFVLFGDLSLSTTLGDRRGITLKISGERYLEYDQIGIQATERFCIVNHDIGDTSVAGPVVAGVGTT